MKPIGFRPRRRAAYCVLLTGSLLLVGSIAGGRSVRAEVGSTTSESGEVSSPSEGTGRGVSTNLGSGEGSGAPMFDNNIEVDAEVESLRADVQALEQLLVGQLSTDFNTQTLFEIDLLNPTAIQTQIATLEASLSTAPARRQALIESLRLLGEEAQAPVLFGEADESDDASDALGTGLGTGEGVAEGSGTGEGVGTGLGAPASTREPLVQLVQAEGSFEVIRFDLATRRDELRLAFLQQTQAQRAAILSAEVELQRINAEQESATQAASEAAEQAVEAEAAQQIALESAREADSAIQRDLLNERARIESLRSELADVAATIAARRQRLASQASARLELRRQIQTSLASLALGHSAADALYDAVVSELVASLSRLRRALDALGTDPPVPDLEWRLDIDAPVYSVYEQERDALRESSAAFSERRRAVLADSANIRWDEARTLADEIRTLNQSQFELLPVLSRSKRQAVFGLGSEGFAQLFRELDQVQLMARWWWHRTARDAPSWPERFGSLLGRSTPRLNLLWLVVLIGAGVAVFRRRALLRGRVRAQVFSNVRASRLAAMAAQHWLSLWSLATEIALLVWLILVMNGLQALTGEDSLRVLRTLVVGYGWYRVAVMAVLVFLTGRLPAALRDTELRSRIRASVRTAGRYCYFVVIVLVISDKVLGRGYLHQLVLNFAWIGAIPIAFMLLRRWYEEIGKAYASRYPTTRIGQRLKGQQRSVVGYLAAIPAAARLVFNGTVNYLKDVASRFERFRRALAFLSRRRMAKQAEERGHRRVDVSMLPKELRQAFESDSLDLDNALNYFPECDRIADLVKSWVAGGPGFGLALIGERGMGKTTWMRELVRRVPGLEAAPVAVPDRLLTAEAACGWLAEILGVPTARHIDELVDRVEAESVRKVILLDHGQNLMLRTVGGTKAFETVVDLSVRTQRQIVWVCAFSRYSWRYLQRVEQSQNLFRHQVELSGWPEERIAELLRSRMARINYEASFQDLLVGHMEGAALDNAIVRTGEEFFRLLWDYSDGNPRVAMHFWLRSLVPTDRRRVRVRVFETPDVDELEKLHERSRFLLAAIVVHENLTLSEVARVVRYSTQDCAALLSFLETHGFIVEETTGRFRITTHSYRAVIRNLTYKRLLFT